MVKALVSGLFKIVMKLVSIVLIPLDLLIKSFIPDLTVVFRYINGFFDYLGSVASIGVSYLGYYGEVLNTIILLLTLIISIPLATHTVKLAIKWYQSLMP